jgi:hypothetical protein
MKKFSTFSFAPMKFQRAGASRNPLADKCHQRDFPVHEFLLDENLGVCVRNQLTGILEYLLGEDRRRRDHGIRLWTVFDWALTRALDWLSPPNLKLGQINRNATTLLSSPWRKLWDAIVKKRREGDGYPFALLLNFVRGPLREDRMFAGHFESIFETFIRCSIGAMDWLSDGDRLDILRFATTHVTVPAYQQLICHLGSDFKDFFKDTNGYAHWIRNLVQQAAWHTFCIHEVYSRGLVRRPASLAASQRAIHRAVSPDSRALPLANVDYEAIPTPTFLGQSKVPWVPRTQPGYKERLTQRYQIAGFLPSHVDPSRQPDVFLRHAQLSAYFLLSAVAAITLEDPGTFAHLGDALEPLLICGVYSDATSMVSNIAFRLLTMLLYGVEAEDDVKPLLPDKEREAIIDMYAQDFTFNDELSPQMVSAFSVFWNHRYEDLDDGKLYPLVEVKLWAPPNSGMSDESYRIERGKGMTPLERYGRYLLDEPPMSDAFNSAIRRVLERWAKHVDRIRGVDRDEPADPGENMAYQKRVVEADRVFFEFFRTRIVYGGVEGDMTLVLKALPLDPLDDYFTVGRLPERRQPPAIKLQTPELLPFARGQTVCRVALNGNPFWLASFWANSTIFCLGQGVNDFVKVSPMIRPMDVEAKVTKTNELMKAFEGNAKLQPVLGQGEGRELLRSKNYMKATTNGE